MSRVSIPRSYSEIPFQNVRILTQPPNQLEATKVMILEMNRPGKRNTFTEGLENDMVDAIRLFDLDDRVKVVVVTGAGKMFCAGADLDLGLHRVEGERSKDHRDGGGRLTVAIHRCRKPVIAAIHGSAVGVGMTMTLPMAIRIASAKAKVGFVFARRGVVMEACSSFFLPRLIGFSKALYLTTTGRIVTADSPAVRDLFAEVLPSPAEVLPRALEIAADVAQNTSSVSTYLMKEMMWRNPGSAEATHLLDSEIMYQLYDKKDKIEGIASFLEKRVPSFEGSVLHDMPDCVPWWPRIEVEKSPKPTLGKL